MWILGAIAFTIIGLVVLMFLASEYSKEQKAKAERADDLRNKVENAMLAKDVVTLKRIKLLDGSKLEEIDKGLGARIETFVDELEIEADDNAKFGGKKVAR
jgi:hypothetical protein